MRKLIISILVLGMATSVQADLSGIELSVNGVYDGPENVTEVTLEVCQTIVIDMSAPEGYNFTAYLIIEGDPPQGGEWGDNLGPPYASGYYFEDSNYPALGAGAGEDSTFDRYEEADWGYGYWVSDTKFLGVNPGGTVAEFLYHQSGLGDVVITLWDAGGGYVTPDDTIIIHEIPEPAMICLFGFGALNLLRRKRRP